LRGELPKLLQQRGVGRRLESPKLTDTGMNKMKEYKSPGFDEKLLTYLILAAGVAVFIVMLALIASICA
jgi:hypothetical protein